MRKNKMSFVVPGPEAELESRIKEVSTITYTTNSDTGKIKNLVRIVMVPPFNVENAIEFLDEHGMIVLKIEAVDDECGIWVDKDSDEDTPCGNDVVLFVYLSPANPKAGQEEVAEAVRKIKAIAGIR